MFIIDVKRHYLLVVTHLLSGKLFRPSLLLDGVGWCIVWPFVE